jgi:plasmid stabilization system protein ParE
VARIIWTDAAIEDLRAIGEFYARSSPEFASSIVTALYESAGRLRIFPQSGRVVPFVFVVCGAVQSTKLHFDNLR